MEDVIELNMHFKDIHGKHRIVEGTLDMINDPVTVKEALHMQGIAVRAAQPVMGLIIGGKQDSPSAA